MNTKNNFILFDFDGVIANSFAPAFEVEKMICPNLTEEYYRKGFEGNINNWQKDDIKHDDKCKHDIDFFSEYIPKMKEQVKIVPGIDMVLRELVKDYSLIIISSTLTDGIKEFLEKYKLSNFFIEIMGNDIHTSKIKKIEMVFSKYNTDSKRCIFITDTLGDLREASHVGVGAIGVSWGFHEKETLERGKPFKIVDSPKDLIGSISDYFLKTQ